MAQCVSLSHALSRCRGWVRTGGLAAMEQPDVLEPHVDLRRRPKNSDTPKQGVCQ